MQQIKFFYSFHQDQNHQSVHREAAVTVKVMDSNTVQPSSILVVNQMSAICMALRMASGQNYTHFTSNHNSDIEQCVCVHNIKRHGQHNIRIYTQKKLHTHCVNHVNLLPYSHNNTLVHNYN